MNTRWFKPWGWIYRPVSVAGIVLIVLAAAFCAQVIVVVNAHTHSVSDFLYGIFPFVVPSLMVLNWIASKTSSQTSRSEP
jgi:hypothetical protein